MEETGVVFVDLSKAFDTIGHSVLLNKLSVYGIKDKEFEWFCSYHFNRKNYVCVDKDISSAEPVYCGVPQGSILGPLLFILFINDLSDFIEHASVIMYADDTVLYVSHDNKEKIESELNKDMQNLLSYFRENELIINLKPGKTEIMLFGIAKRLKTVGEQFQILYNNQEISFTNTYKYLENIIDHHLNCSENFEKSYKKASGRLRLLERMRCYLTLKAARLVYIMMVVPLVTLGCTLKSPYNATQKLKLASLDKRARKIVKSNVPSIDNFANRERTLFVKKCLCKESNEELNNYFQVFEHKYTTRNNEKSIKLPPVTLEVSKQGLYFSGGVLYNKLPIEIRNVGLYKEFKKLVKVHFS